MNQFMRGVVRAAAESFDLPGPVVEIGSYQVDGQADAINLRGLFPDREYVGVDFRAGPGVDLVANVERLPFRDASVGTVVATSAFEHVRRFWVGFDEVFRVLRPDGVFVVTCPFYFHVHGYPDDYWRFTPSALESLLDRYPTRVNGHHGAERRPQNVWSVAFRERAAVPTAGQFTAYRAKLAEYATEPLSAARRWRYRLGRVIAGRRPFAPYLDRDRWHAELVADPAAEVPDVLPFPQRRVRVANRAA